MQMAVADQVCFFTFATFLQQPLTRSQRQGWGSGQNSRLSVQRPRSARLCEVRYSILPLSLQKWGLKCPEEDLNKAYKFSCRYLRDIAGAVSDHCNKSKCYKETSCILCVCVASQNIWKLRLHYTVVFGLPGWLRGKESTCQYRRRGFDPWVRTIPWRMKWNPLQHPCLENSGTEETGGLQSMGSPRVGHHWATDHILWSIKCAKALCLKQTYLFILKCFTA